MSVNKIHIWGRRNSFWAFMSSKFLYRRGEKASKKAFFPVHPSMKCITNYFRRKRNQVLWVWVLFNGCWICPFIWSNCLLNLKNQHIPVAAVCACKTALFELNKHHLHSAATMDRILFPYRCLYAVFLFYIWVSLQLWVKNAIFAIYDY